VVRVLARTKRRIERLVAARAEGDDDALARDEPLLATLAPASLRSRIARGQGPAHDGDGWAEWNEQLGFSGIQRASAAAP
jgi:hypothetical protein